MPRANRFRHQAYRSDRPTSPYHLLNGISPTEPESDRYREQLRAAGEVFGREGVAGVFCLHGTFAALDPTGLVLELARYAPAASEKLLRLGKRVVDLLIDESGNYTPQFARSLSEQLSSGAGRAIPVELFVWSGQNNHIGRADAAVRLLVRLAEFAESDSVREIGVHQPPRVMLWGHSHGGNALALITNLLAADKRSRDEFFQAAQRFYRSWSLKTCCFPEWSKAEQLLDDAEHPLRKLALEMVTFGTPIRYGWDTDGYARLLHFVHHRPSPDRKEFQAAWPIYPRRFFRASDGDYIQHLGIARTNLMPFPLALRAVISDFRLHRFLQRELEFQWLLARLGCGVRVADEGTVLLVDYDCQSVMPWIFQHLAGHAIYTRRKWLPFHCREIIRHFYGVEI